jgi:hypothetical protein
VAEDVDGHNRIERLAKFEAGDVGVDKPGAWGAPAGQFKHEW